MTRVTEATRSETLPNVAERLRPYMDPSFDAPRARETEASRTPSPFDDLMDRVLTLVAIMPPGQRRATIAELVSPHEPERGGRAVEQLIRDSRLSEDDLGHLRLFRRPDAES